MKKKPKPEVDLARQKAADRIGLAALDLLTKKSIERAARIAREQTEQDSAETATS